jgi:hypothetical protein
MRMTQLENELEQERIRRIKAEKDLSVLLTSFQKWSLLKKLKQIKYKLINFICLP